MWPLVRLVVGLAVAVPIAVIAVGALTEGDHRGGRPSGSASGPAPPDATPPPPTPGPTPGACPESGLAVRPGLVEAAMGLRVMQIVVTNCGTVPRTVRGHPSVRLLDENREPMDVAATPGSSGIATVARFDAPPAAVTLRPGERATTALLWRNKVTSAMGAALGRYVEVTVAGGGPPQVIEPDGGVDVGTTGKVGVAPWVAYR
jgi:hypothetical protein